MNVLTIDLEEWFHVLFESDVNSWGSRESRVKKNTEFILNALSARNSKATFFSLGWIARQYPDLIRMIDEAGFEIGSHSDNHRAVYQFSKSDFKEDVKRSILSLEAITGKKVRAFRAPYFSLREPVAHYMETLVENGIEIDSSICTVKTKFGGYENFPQNQPCIVESGGLAIKELPLNTYKIYNKRIIFSGGGYFRLFPLFVMKRLINKQPYNMAYFHPHDFDGEQPSLNLSIIADTRRTIGSATAGQKFKALLSSIEFVDVAACDKIIDWTRAPVVNLPHHD
ncbi:hypothetical protein A0256_13395 [Mucilaginibacter sp. PAMC 26640]|nr:hypothetical protein A0256_13395 [Mucilaginibacter sp. PAMC 26640]